MWLILTTYNMSIIDMLNYFFVLCINKVSELYRNLNSCGNLQLQNFKELSVDY